IAPAVVTLFNVRFSVNTTGDTVVLGNTLETASTVGNPGRTAQDVINAQNGTGAFVNNNDWNTVYVDVDGNPATFDSSRATPSNTPPPSPTRGRPPRVTSSSPPPSPRPRPTSPAHCGYSPAPTPPS